jgi:hypothetical protein
VDDEGEAVLEAVDGEGHVLVPGVPGSLGARGLELPFSEIFFRVEDDFEILFHVDELKEVGAGHFFLRGVRERRGEERRGEQGRRGRTEGRQERGRERRRRGRLGEGTGRGELSKERQQQERNWSRESKRREKGGRREKKGRRQGRRWEGDGREKGGR